MILPRARTAAPLLEAVEVLPLRVGPLAEELVRELERDREPADDAAGELAAEALREASAPPATQPAVLDEPVEPDAESELTPVRSFERVSGRRLATLPFGASADAAPAAEPPAAPTAPTPQSAPASPPEITSGPIGLQDATTEYAPQPVYPRRAVEQRLEGEVTLLALVKADGTVGACEVETSSGHALLDEAAKVALLKWRFKPRFRDGELRPFTARVPFRFFIPR